MSSPSDRTSKNLPFTQSSSSLSESTTARTSNQFTNAIVGNKASSPIFLSPSPEPRSSPPSAPDDTKDIDNPIFLPDYEPQVDEVTPFHPRNLIPAYANAPFRRRQLNNAARRVAAEDIQQDNTRSILLDFHIRRTAASAQQPGQDTTSRLFPGADGRPTDLRRLASMIRPRPSYQTKSQLGNPINTGRRGGLQSTATKSISSSPSAHNGVRKKSSRPKSTNGSHHPGNFRLHAPPPPPAPKIVQPQPPTKKSPGSASPLLHGHHNHHHNNNINGSAGITTRDNDAAIAAMRRTAEAQRSARGEPINLSLSSSPIPDASNKGKPPIIQKQKDLRSLQSILQLRADSYARMLKRANFETAYSEAEKDGMKTDVQRELKRGRGAGTVVAVVERVVRGSELGAGGETQTGVNGNGTENGDENEEERRQSTGKDVLKEIEVWERRENVKLLVLKKGMCEMLKGRIEGGLKDLKELRGADGRTATQGKAVTSDD